MLGNRSSQAATISGSGTSLVHGSWLRSLGLLAARPQPGKRVSKAPSQRCKSTGGQVQRRTAELPKSSLGRQAGRAAGRSQQAEMRGGSKAAQREVLLPERGLGKPRHGSACAGELLLWARGTRAWEGRV